MSRSRIHTSRQGAYDQLMAEEASSDGRRAKQLARRQLIAEAVMAEGSIRIEDLTTRFNISLMTAHRDLDKLEARGLLRKTRGTVSAAPTSLVESSDVYRSVRQSAEKRAIALAALDFVEPGQAIFMDDSTTVSHMAPHLGDRTPLTVITNSLSLMNDLRSQRNLTLLGLGGQYHSWCNAFMGRMTINEIATLRADAAFLSMAAITDDMLFHQSPEMVETKRAMFDSASKRILLADHTKFTRRALHGFNPLAAFDAIIVDTGVPATDLDRIRALGPEVVTVSPSGR